MNRRDQLSKLMQVDITGCGPVTMHCPLPTPENALGFELYSCHCSKAPILSNNNKNVGVGLERWLNCERELDALQKHPG